MAAPKHLSVLLLLSAVALAAAVSELRYGHTVMVDAGSSKCEVFTFQWLKFENQESKDLSPPKGKNTQDVHLTPSPKENAANTNFEEEEASGKEESASGKADKKEEAREEAEKVGDADVTADNAGVDAPKSAEEEEHKKDQHKEEEAPTATDLTEEADPSMSMADGLLKLGEKVVRAAHLRGGAKTVEFLQLEIGARVHARGGKKKEYKCPDGVKAFPGIDKFTGMQNMERPGKFDIDKVKYHELSLKDGQVTILSAYLECLLHSANSFFKGYDDATKEASNVYMRATAGMRLRRLEGEEMKDKVVFLEMVIREFLRRAANSRRSEFAILPQPEAHVDFFATIPGSTEAKYDWIAVNYLHWLSTGGKRKGSEFPAGLESEPNSAGLGEFGSETTVGALDLGGASGQIAFEVDPELIGEEKHPKYKNLIKYNDKNEWISGDRIHAFEFNGREHLLYHQSWLLYGVVEALRRFMMVKSNYAAVKPYNSYCFRKGMIGSDFIGSDGVTRDSRFKECVFVGGLNSNSGIFSLLHTNPDEERYASGCPTIYDKDIKALKDEYEDCTFFVQDKLVKPSNMAGGKEEAAEKMAFLQLQGIDEEKLSDDNEAPAPLATKEEETKERKEEEDVNEKSADDTASEEVVSENVEEKDVEHPPLPKSPRLKAPLAWRKYKESNFFAIGAGFYFAIQPAMRTACKFSNALATDSQEGEFVLRLLMDNVKAVSEQDEEVADAEDATVAPADEVKEERIKEEPHTEVKPNVNALMAHYKSLSIDTEMVQATCAEQSKNAAKFKPIVLTLAQLSELAEFYCELPWTSEEEQNCSPDPDSPTCDRNVCFKIAYVHTLLSQGYGFSEKDTVTFAKKIAGMDAAWVPGAVIDIEAQADKTGKGRIRRVEAMQEAWVTWKERFEFSQLSHAKEPKEDGAEAKVEDGATAEEPKTKEAERKHEEATHEDVKDKPEAKAEEAKAENATGKDGAGANVEEPATVEEPKREEATHENVEDKPETTGDATKKDGAGANVEDDTTAKEATHDEATHENVEVNPEAKAETKAEDATGKDGAGANVEEPATAEENKVKSEEEKAKEANTPEDKPVVENATDKDGTTGDASVVAPVETPKKDEVEDATGKGVSTGGDVNGVAAAEAPKENATPKDVSTGGNASGTPAPTETPKESDVGDAATVAAFDAGTNKVESEH